MKYVRIVLLALTVGLLAACSSTQASNSGGPVDVQIKLSEMKIDSSLTTFSVGVPYHFIVTNAGTVPHEIMIMPTMMNGGTMSSMPMEQLDQMALAHIESADLPSGATKMFDYTFTKPTSAGTLEFACYLPGHYEAGMHESITLQ